jgi:CHASE2 domain-containing sensor protein
MSPLASTLFYVGAALMLLDAASYSLGAIRPIRAGIKAPNAYWDRRLLLNLLLANMGLYFTALFTFIGAFLARNMPQAAQLVLLLSLVVCLYSGVSVTLLTPKDWLHTLPRVLAAVLIGIGLLIR